MFACAGKTEPPSRLIFSQTSAGQLNSPGAHATWSLLASKVRLPAKTPHAMRASLLASAIASTLRCSRFLAASSLSEEAFPGGQRHPKNSCTLYGFGVPVRTNEIPRINV